MDNFIPAQLNSQWLRLHKQAQGKGYAGQKNTPKPQDRHFNNILWSFFTALILFGIFFLIFSVFTKVAGASEIDLSIIAQIESSGNPLAYNKQSGVRGLYQFLPIAWKDVQQHYPELKKYSYLPYVHNPEISKMFAEKYFLILEKYLKHYKKPVTINHLCWAYNAGIGKVVKGIMPVESRQYIAKYKRLAGK